MYLWVFIASWKPTFIEFSRSDVSLLAYISWSKLYYFFCIFDIISSFFLLLAFTVEEVCCIAYPWTSALLMLLELLFLYCLFVKAINCEEKPWLSLYISAKYKMYKPKIISCRRYYWKNSLPVLTQRWIIFSKPLDALTEIAENIYLDALILLNLRQSKEAFPIQA